MTDSYYEARYDFVDCPICGQSLNGFYEVTCDGPWTAFDAREGLEVWGPADAPKLVICEDERYVHFVIGDEVRLVKMVKPGESDSDNFYEYWDEEADRFDDYEEEEIPF